MISYSFVLPTLKGKYQDDKFYEDSKDVLKGESHYTTNVA